MNDTPETDDQPIIYAINDNGYQVPCVDLEFARRLKRERDEARHKLELCMAANSDVARIAKERDEALEHAARYRLEANKLIMMGIELREQNAKLCDIAERAIDDLRWFYEGKSDSLVYELDKLKEGAK
jgi:hypothetical protein